MLVAHDRVRLAAEGGGRGRGGKLIRDNEKETERIKVVSRGGILETLRERNDHLGAQNEKEHWTSPPLSEVAKSPLSPSSFTARLALRAQPRTPHPRVDVDGSSSTQGLAQAGEDAAPWVAHNRRLLCRPGR